MQPSEFWACDPWTLVDINEGYLDDVHLRLTGKHRVSSRTGLTKGEIEELQRWMDEDDD